MAKWIDKAALWAFTAASFYFLMLQMSKGSIAFSFVSTFICIVLLRSLLGKLSRKQWVRRSEKTACAKSILKSWAMMHPAEALNEISHRLPELTSSQEQESVRLIQRTSDGSLFDTNLLMDIWRNSPELSRLHLIITGPVQPEVRDLAASLEKPAVRITDSASIIPMLLKTIHEIPARHKNTGQRLLSKARAARYMESLKPMRTAFYGALFAGIYVFSRSWIHLTAAGLLLILTLIRLVFVRISQSA